MCAYNKFAEYYDLIYKEIVNYENECQILKAVFGKCCEGPKTVLDLGCGTGSHTVVFSKCGYSVTGIDISPAMIKKAREKAEKEGINTEFLAQDMRRLNLKTKFQCAVCMFGAFGYLLTDEDLAIFLSGLYKHLDEGGIFVYEYWNIGGLKPSPYQSWMKAQDENVTVYRMSESNFDRKTNVLNIEMNFVVISKDKQAETFTENHKIRCYTLEEMENLLKNNGFEPVVAYDWGTKDALNLKAPEKETFRILAVARKKS
jgi:SAM-dependent methyltransferase